MKTNQKLVLFIFVLIFGGLLTAMVIWSSNRDPCRGKDDGIMTLYHFRGRPKLEVNCSNEVRDGEEIRWNEDKKIVSRILFRNGQLITTYPLTDD